MSFHQQHNPDATIQPFANFNAEADAQELKKALKGLGTDEQALINILCNRSLHQRLRIREHFWSLFGKDLLKEVRSDLSGDFGDVIQGLLMTPFEFDAKCINDAIKRGGAHKESTLSEIILCSSTNAELQTLQGIYQKLYKKDLEQEITHTTNPFYRRILIACLQGNRAEITPQQHQQYLLGGFESIIDRGQARQDAQVLLSLGVKKWATEDAFFQILLNRDPAQLRATVDEYERMSSKDFFLSVEKEVSGDMSDAIQSVVLCRISQPVYYARLLYYAMKGLGTRDHTLIRVMVTRSELDLGDIKNEFTKGSGKNLQRFITGDTSGDYRKTLLAIVK